VKIDKPNFVITKVMQIPNKRMNVVAIIHARGGSKRIPLKNIKLLAGKPLISYMIGAARSANLVQRVIVSTDHPEIARIAKECGAEVPFIRPNDIAEDVASELVTRHAVKFLEEVEHYPVDIAITMQPTTPFCTASDIDGAVQMLIESGADSVISACEIHERPEWMFFTGADGFAVKFIGAGISGDIGISQKLPLLYVPNGGIYATRREILFTENAIFGEKIKLWIMSRERSVDIDDPIDFEFAELLVKKFF
jgi:CMP-N-acetylneuraminic acid synthetase